MNKTIYRCLYSSDGLDIFLSAFIATIIVLSGVAGVYVYRRLKYADLSPIILNHQQK